MLLASSVGSHEETLDLVRAVRRPDVQVSIVPRFFEIFTSHSTLDDIEGMPVVTLPPIRLGRSARVLKRSVDVLASGMALLLLSPVLAVIALSIRLDSNGPALYRQPRRGRLGSTFEIVKFRTMYVGAEQRRSEVLHMNEVDGPLFKIKGSDPRVTRVGNFLRRTSLDELPQLWNVLKGEMSLVGPRPFVVYEADKITGWATAAARHDPRHHGPVAGPRAERHPVRGDDEARLPLRHELVGVVGLQDPLPDDPGRARQARRVLSPRRLVRVGAVRRSNARGSAAAFAALVAVLAVASGASGAVSIAGATAERANLWVDPSGGSCTRQVAAGPFLAGRACSSATAAYAAASERDVVVVRAGTYGRQVFRAGRSA